jgi:multisubunit Na+/H+ antiporter MnhB subunit
MHPLLDPLLAVAVVWLAWMALASRDLFRAVILYIVYGLLMALAWVRLRAPDIALAEAAIGAGLTGALLLDAVAQMASSHRRHVSERPADAALAGQAPPAGSSIPGVRVRTLVAFASLALAAVLVAAVLQIPLRPGGLTALVAEHLDLSGVTHPVTAVLLNFRSFDTWLEVGVLLLAVLAALIVGRTHDLREVRIPRTDDRLLAGLPSLVIPAMVLVGGYLLWLGTHAPGGAFQAGAVLASAGVLLLLAGRRSVTALRGRVFKLAVLIGFGGFLIAALATLLLGGLLLELSPRWAGTVILLIEAGVTVSIGVTLAALFAVARSPLPSPSLHLRERR